MRTIPTEHAEQSSVVRYIRARGRHCFSVNNEAGGGRNFRLLNWKRQHGMMRGVPDLILIEPSNDGRHIAVEMKRKKGGRLSEDQIEVIKMFKASNWIVIVATGYDDAVRQLKVLGV